MVCTSTCPNFCTMPGASSRRFSRMPVNWERIVSLEWPANGKILNKEGWNSLINQTFYPFGNSSSHCSWGMFEMTTKGPERALSDCLAFLCSEVQSSAAQRSITVSVQAGNTVEVKKKCSVERKLKETSSRISRSSIRRSVNCAASLRIL